MTEILKKKKGTSNLISLQQGSKYPLWKPEYGSDGAEYVFFGDPPRYLSPISYFAALNFSIEIKRKFIYIRSFPYLENVDTIIILV